ncbi:MAG: DUF2207 domain-containing protein [Alphaproteobacteria bacterium]
MRFPRAAIPLLFGLLLAIGPVAAQERERIVEFRSDVVVEADGALTVTENIRVVATGQQIKRGIIRDFPTRYTGKYGETVNVGFQLLQVMRDGAPERYKTESLSNGLRIYIGDKNVFIPQGEYVYTLVYRTTRQLGFFDDYDELYWNVTGSDWTFEIETARASVTLPDGAELINWSAYTGKPGERGQDFRTAYQPAAALAVETSRPLAPGEGFTIAVAWPKGFVAEPTASDRAAGFARDNASVMAGLAGLAILLAYFAIVWVKVGRDPAKGAIVPEYEPPKGFSPAAARFLTEMNYDGKAFTAAIVNMAVQGFLTIEEDGDGDYTLVKTGGKTGEEVDLAPGEATVARKLFSYGQNEVQLKQKNHKRLGKAQKALKKSLQRDYEKTYFLTNTGLFLPGLAITLMTFGLVAVFGTEPAGAAFITLWLSFWSLGCYALANAVIGAWRKTTTTATGTGSLLQAGGAIYITLFAVPFFGGWIFGAWFLVESVSVAAALTLACVLLADVVFYDLLKAPTRLGRKVLDRLEGFELYLSVAEEDRMNFHNPPERTPELFEKFLPYALALGVEQAWSEQFAEVLAVAARSPGQGGAGYQPRWYSGRGFHQHGVSDFASNLGGSFSGAIAASSTAPGSSSGSGGGGSSGGGGGGGGGSGW